MKTILVISDTHGSTRTLEQILPRFPKLDLLIHLGDVERDAERISTMVTCPSIIVRGNCDRRGDLPQNRIVDIGDQMAFLTHGHLYGVNWGIEELVDEAKSRGCSIAMYGHTHVPQITERDNVLVLNPGSLSLPRPSGTAKPSWIVGDVDSAGGIHWSLGVLENW